MIKSCRLIAKHAMAKRMFAALALGGCAIFLGLASPVAAQDYPTKPIKLIVPFAPGGGNDTIARTLGQRLSQALGQPVVIDNRPGAGGKLGVEIGVRSAPDGYTLTLISNSYAVNPSLYSLPFDPINDITPIGMIASGPFLVAVNPSLPVKTLGDLVALAKKKPGELTYASSGLGGISHLATELFLHTTGTDMIHVPYKGSAPALTDTVSGQVDIFFSTAGAALPYVQANRLRVLAETLPNRIEVAPTIATVKELGIPYEVIVWYGLIGPKGIPVEVRDRLNKEMNIAMQDPDIKNLLRKNGESPVSGTSDMFLKQIKDEMAVWSKVVKQSSIKVE